MIIYAFEEEFLNIYINIPICCESGKLIRTFRNISDSFIYIETIVTNLFYLPEKIAKQYIFFRLCTERKTTKYINYYRILALT